MCEKNGLERECLAIEQGKEMELWMGDKDEKNNRLRYHKWRDPTLTDNNSIPQMGAMINLVLCTWFQRNRKEEEREEGRREEGKEEGMNGGMRNKRAPLFLAASQSGILKVVAK